MPDVSTATPAQPSTPKLLSLADRIKGREKTLLAIGIAIQFLVPVGMIVQKTLPFWTGETMLFRVTPADPHYIFRGNYVALSYEFSRIPPEEIAGLEPRQYNEQGNGWNWNGKTVYVPLVPEADGKHWKAQKPFSIQRPASGKFLRGTIVGWDSTIQYGIEEFYVQEEQGREYESTAQSRTLSAKVAVASDGTAAMGDLLIEGTSATTLPPEAFAGPSYDKGRLQYRYPSGTDYRVRRLPHANIKLDASLGEREWSLANVERHFTFPWETKPAPATEFLAFCDDEFFYFAFRVEDADIFTLDKLRDKQDVVFEDRVEMFFSPEYDARRYFCLEIDSLGRTYDFQAAYYRQFDPKWHCKGLETAGKLTDKGYVVEGRIPIKTLESLGITAFRRDQSGQGMICGLYRAEFSHDRSGKPVVQESIHPGGPTLDITPPLEAWMSWIDPKTPEPDFHVPSSFGRLVIVE
jgi:uncharacterized membrane-anchored protein